MRRGGVPGVSRVRPGWTARGRDPEGRASKCPEMEGGRLATVRSEGRRTLAGDREEVVGDVGLDWEVKVKDDGGGRTGACPGLCWTPQVGFWVAQVQR